MQNLLNDPEPDGDTFQCESCGKVIAKGAKYAVTLDGCYLCEEDAPSLQDCVDYWAHHAAEDDDEREAAADCIEELAAHVASGGSPEDKPLWVME